MVAAPQTGRGLEIAHVFRDCAETYADSRILPPSHTAVLRAVARCRTPALGGHMQLCVDCDYAKIAYNSCRNRHCPTCQSGRQRAWVAQRQARVLPTHHFHVVFTLPSELRALARFDPVNVYEALFAAASRTLLVLGEQRLGGQLGITMVLHTWTRDLRLHPHVHCVVTGGALSREDTPVWKPARSRFLFPVAVMRKLFRGKLMARLQRLRNAGKLRCPPDLIDDKAWRRLRRALFAKRWVVYAKRPFGGPKQVFAYLGRYTHRVAISSARLKTWDGRSVVFRTRGDDVVRLDADEFIRRFLLHILPRQFRKIRHYGLLSPTGTAGRLELARRCLQPDVDPEEAVDDEPNEAVPCCPACGGLLLRLPGPLQWHEPALLDSS